MKDIIFQPEALEALRKMPTKTRDRIMSKIEAYATDPATQANNVKALKGYDAIRLRIGDWRVIIRDGVVIDVLRIGPRGKVYKGLK